MVPLAIVDAFASEPFTGNPAAVCLLDAPREDVWMQRVASELNMPITAFVHPSGDAYDLRWFTTMTEVELCGHGTLAASHVLWERGQQPHDRPVRFHTRGGDLTASRCQGWIELDFPGKLDQQAPPPSGLLEALHVKPVYVGRNQFDYIIELEHEEAVRKVEPDFELLRKVQTRGVIVTARSSSGAFDFVSRFFAPSVGINEDVATGSAHCCLGPFWARRLAKTTFVAHQASARGATIRVSVHDDRVRLAGQAVTVVSGDLKAVHTQNFPVSHTTNAYTCL